MFERYNIKTTWFIPGHSLETFPEECRMIADAGHEIGMAIEDVNPMRSLLTYDL
jgi:peptidoglycan/xylan/chitin deacetylase (PgdA/CDA1 family)